MYLLPQFSEEIHATGFVRKRMIWRINDLHGILIFALIAEKMAPKVGTVGQK